MLVGRAIADGGLQIKESVAERAVPGKSPILVIRTHEMLQTVVVVDGAEEVDGVLVQVGVRKVLHLPTAVAQTLPQNNRPNVLSLSIVHDLPMSTLRAPQLPVCNRRPV